MQVESAGSIDTSTHVCIKEEGRKPVCVISYMHTMSDKIETAVEPGVATAPTAAQQVAADTDEVLGVATAAEAERRLQISRRENAARIERNDRRLREREAMIEHVVPEPVVATAPTAAEQRAARAAFDRAEEVRLYQAGLRAAAENKANRERERAYWRGDF